jgi:hypothetical protein
MNMRIFGRLSELEDPDMPSRAEGLTKLLAANAVALVRKFLLVTICFCPFAKMDLTTSEQLLNLLSR